jgi:sirohydrochlorin ferrochelatase
MAATTLPTRTASDEKLGIIIVDHGSRRAESNRMLEDVAALFAKRFAGKYHVVQAAHMELCEPSIDSAYRSCVESGATRVVVAPFFLGPGKHWSKDIPALTAEAAGHFPNTKYHVTAPLGIDDLILDLLDKRVSHCGSHQFNCELCAGTLRSGEPGIPFDAPDHKDPAPCAACPYAKAGIPLPVTV